MSGDADYGRPAIWEEIGAFLRGHRIAVGRIFGWVRCEPGWSWERVLSEYDIWSVVAGTGEAWLNGRRQELRAGVVLLLRPGDRITATQHPFDRLSVGYAHYTHRISGPPPDVLPSRVVELHDPAPVNDRLREVVQRLEQPDSASPLQAEALLHTALLEVHTQAAQRSGHLPSPVDPRIREAIERLRSQPSTRPSLPEAARTAGLSAAHFSRLFRHETGSSFRSFCVQARMDRARGLLADTAFSAAEIAQLLGYVDYRLFARQFARHHGGRSPSVWRSSTA